MQKLIILFIILFFLTGLKSIYAAEKVSVEIISLGQIDNSVLDHLEKNLSEIFDVEVSIGKAQLLPAYAYNKKRNQYLSSDILSNLLRFKKDRGQKILAIIDKDLYVPQLNFVFGQAEPLNGVCIISTARLRQSYYGLLEDKALFLKRVLKEAVHEIGHLLNLRHCPKSSCVMHFSNSLLDTDRKDYNFCDNCKRLLP